MGSLWRAGEGQTKNWLAVLGIVVGAALTTDYLKDDFYDLFNAKARYLPKELGTDTEPAYFLAVLLVLAILAAWYWVVKWNEKTEKLVVE
jgi:uncharacterized membrane protein YedE/YeeE